MTPKQPEISVIVPIYNAGEYLSPCIRSVLAQTFTDFELILVDDASTDGSLDVCRSFADPRIRIISNPVNQGLSMSRNVGIENAKGSYITFLDADDLIHPKFFEFTLRNLTATQSQIVAVEFRLIPNVWNCTYGSVTEEFLSFEPIDAVEVGLYQLIQLNSACGKLYDIKLFKEFRYRKVGYEDLDSFYKLFLSASKIVYMTSAMYFYRMNPGSYIHTFTPERAVVLDVTERIVDFMERNYPQLVPAAKDRALSAAFNVFNLLVENKAKLPDVENRCKETIRRYRKASLLNPKVRLKNKLGILVTYFGGFRLLKCMARLGKFL